MTYPAPKYLKDDPWFGPAYYSDKQLSFMQVQTHKEKIKNKPLPYVIPGCDEKFDTIHEIMYAVSINSGKTTLQLNPIGGSENFQGGSENYHEKNDRRSS